jgi:hypothetical protein
MVSLSVTIVDEALIFLDTDNRYQHDQSIAADWRPVKAGNCDNLNEMERDCLLTRPTGYESEGVTNMSTARGAF